MPVAYVDTRRNCRVVDAFGAGDFGGTLFDGVRPKQAEPRNILASGRPRILFSYVDSYPSIIQKACRPEGGVTFSLTPYRVI